MVKKYIAAVLIMAFIATPIHSARAGYWGENFAANTMKQLLEEISIQVREAINASAKMIAIKQTTSILETLLYGGSSSMRNITNYHKFLVEDPQKEAVTYANDFLTTALRGTTSGDYTPAGGSGSDTLGQALQQAGKSTIKGLSDNSTPVADYTNHCSDTSDYFADGNFRCFSAIMSNPINTPIGLSLAIDQAATAKYLQEKEVAVLDATSSGVLSIKDDSGNITTPKSVVEELQLQQVTLPLEAIAFADTGVFATMIQSFAVGMVTGIVERGLGEVEQAIDKNVDALERQYTDQMGEYYDSIGPGLEYADKAYTEAKKVHERNNYIPPDI